MPTLRLTWHAVHDDRTCPICLALDGYTWVYETGQHQFTDDLVHPEFGVVWNVQEGSRAHGHTHASCRCSITPEFDFKDLLTQCQNLLSVLEGKMGKELPIESR